MGYCLLFIVYYFIIETDYNTSLSRVESLSEATIWSLHTQTLVPVTTDLSSHSSQWVGESCHVTSEPFAFSKLHTLLYIDCVLFNKYFYYYHICTHVTWVEDNTENLAIVDHNTLGLRIVTNEDIDNCNC